MQRQGAESLSTGDLEAHQGGTVLLEEGLYPSAGIKHDRGQGVGFHLFSFLECIQYDG